MAVDMEEGTCCCGAEEGFFCVCVWFVCFFVVVVLLGFLCGLVFFL